MMVDTHCHVLKSDYDDCKEIISRMKENIMVCSGYDSNSNKEVIKMIVQYPNIYGTIGLHPDVAITYSNDDIDYIAENLTNKKIVGLGEIGLDYHYGKADIKEQKELFIKQLNLARKYNKTVVIHSRDAIEDTFNILMNYRDLKIILHCYSSSVDMAKKFIRFFNIKFGIGGVLTFKNSKTLNEVVKNIDINYFVLETDSPYLTPEPFRGQKNEPYNIIYVAKKIAEIKELPLDDVLAITTSNAQKMYSINR